MKRLFTLLTITMGSFSLFGQVKDSSGFEQRPKSLKEVITQITADSVKFYYNDGYEMVKPICATKFRITRMDTVLLTFTGPFKDRYSNDSTIAIEGNYIKGKKEGDFKFYFRNGQLDQAGKYLNDKKNGLWEYYYEDGSKRQTLQFNNDDTLVLEFWNEKGQHLVTLAMANGQGTKPRISLCERMEGF